MAQKVREVDQQRDKFNRKTQTLVRTDAGMTYVFEQMDDQPKARLARRGRGVDAREACSTRRSALPRQVERVAHEEFGDNWQV